MATRGKAGDVSGFDVVRAVKHVRAGQGSAPPPPKKPPRAPPGPPSPDEGGPPPDGTPTTPSGARIGKTAVPTKHEFVCYECGYRFTVAGKVRTLYCAKCRTVLNQTDYVIDKEHDVSIVTAGSVTIAESGVWTGGSLFARDVVLKGGHTGGTLRATRRLEVHPGAVYRLDAVETESLVVAAGAEVRAAGPLAFKDVEIHGRLEGELTAEGVVRIHPGGHFVGRLTTRHLVVEEGGGLTGDMVIGAVPVVAPESAEPGDGGGR